MNFRLIIFSLLLSSLTQAEEHCDLTSYKNVLNLATDACDVTDKLKSCAKKDQDPDALRKALLKTIDFTEK